MYTDTLDGTELEELAGFLRSHPALRAKNEIRLVSEVLGAGSWGTTLGNLLAAKLCSRPSSPPTPTAPGSRPC